MTTATDGETFAILNWWVNQLPPAERDTIKALALELSLYPHISYNAALATLYKMGRDWQQPGKVKA
jgi:hypothetical protein